MTEFLIPKMVQQAPVTSLLGCCHDAPEWLRIEKPRTVEAELGASHTNLSTPAVRPINLLELCDYKSQSSKRVMTGVVAR